MKFQDHERRSKPHMSNMCDDFHRISLFFILFFALFLIFSVFFCFFSGLFVRLILFSVHVFGVLHIFVYHSYQWMSKYILAQLGFALWLRLRLTLNWLKFIIFFWIVTSFFPLQLNQLIVFTFECVLQVIYTWNCVSNIYLLNSLDNMKCKQWNIYSNIYFVAVDAPYRLGVHVVCQIR